ncbi:hypothetical protein MKW98_004376 [Papaver atlanticum]|uniref:Uncharacterized protein n=1 Tax=Papaver atlanticum TaxID=357466 RepID=A0AAD4SPZ5_9MAGN|nr:hypothetical protein MKW98_004376 [Papaver atlanticum]
MELTNKLVSGQNTVASPEVQPGTASVNALWSGFKMKMYGLTPISSSEAQSPDFAFPPGLFPTTLLDSSSLIRCVCCRNHEN